MDSCTPYVDRYYYAIYRKSDDTMLCSGSAEHCRTALNLKKDSFRHLLYRADAGRGTREVYKEPLEEDD